MSGFWLIRGEAEAADRLEFLRLHLIEKGVWPIRLDIKKHTNKRSVNQNDLFHKWCREISAWLTENNRACSETDVKNLMKYKFLGVADLHVGSEVIPGQLRSTSSLDTGEMHHFMNQVEEWAFALGIPLTIPVASEYYELREGQSQ